MAAEIEEIYPTLEVENVPGSGGVFQVIADGKIVYDKKETGRFPEKGEILGLLEAL